MTSFQAVDLVGQTIAIQAAKYFRALRQRGIAVLKTIDTLITTRCIRDGIALLYSDWHFDPFVAHLRLRSALVNAETTGAPTHPLGSSASLAGNTNRGEL